MPVIRAEASPDDLLDAVAQLPTEELSVFAERVAVLLLRIGRGLPADVRRRYDDLLAKRREERLRSDEHAELVRLTDEVERLDAERIEAIVALARLRGVSAATVMQSLGARPASDGP